MRKKNLAAIALLLILIVLLLSSCEYNVHDNYFYHVTFDSQGGSSIDRQIIIDGMTAVKPVDPVKENCEFVGWFTQDNRVFSFTTRITKDVYLKAQWKAAGGNSKNTVITNIDLHQDNTFEIEKLNTTVFVPAEAISTTATGNLNSELSVTTYELLVSNTRFKAEGNNTAVASLDLDFYLSDDSTKTKVKEFDKEIYVTTYITKGLDKVRVMYNGTGDPAIASETDDGEGTADIYSSDSDMGDVATKLGYSKESGLLRFKTKHFSEYYVISDAEIYIEEDDVAMKLTDFRTSVEAGKTYEGKTITLLKDLDYTSVEWDPIGLYNSIEGGVFKPFSGTFDGNNHTIKYKISNKVNYASLFACIENATIKNLNVSAEIENSFSKPTDESNKCNSSIIVGYATGKNEISDCVASGSIKIKYDVKSKAAGIVAKNDGEIVITNCTNNANIENSGLYTAGIIGESQGVTTEGKPYNFVATIKNCKNTGIIKNTKSDGSDPTVDEEAVNQYPTIVGYCTTFAEVYLTDCSDECTASQSRGLVHCNTSANKAVANGELIYKRVISIEEVDGKAMKYYRYKNDDGKYVYVFNDVTALVTYYDGTSIKVPSEDFSSKKISVATNSSDKSLHLKIDKTYSEECVTSYHYLTLKCDSKAIYVPLWDYVDADNKDIFVSSAGMSTHTWSELFNNNEGPSFKIGDDSYQLITDSDKIYVVDKDNNKSKLTTSKGADWKTNNGLNKRTAYFIIPEPEN